MTLFSSASPVLQGGEDVNPDEGHSSQMSPDPDSDTEPDDRTDPNELVPRPGPNTTVAPMEAYTFRLSVVDEAGVSFTLDCAPTIFTTPDPDDDSYVLAVNPDGINN
jgi:hypothetical protein